MTKQLLFRVDDNVKIAVDAILSVRRESLQELLNRLLLGYIVEHAGTTGNNDALLLAIYSYVTEQQKADIAPLLEKMDEYHLAKATEETKQQELIDTYNHVKEGENGSKLLEILARRLQRNDPLAAISDVYVDNYGFIQALLNANNDIDDNEIIMLCLSLARIHSTQT
jgi:hypothetical protein